MTAPRSKISRRLPPLRTRWRILETISAARAPCSATRPSASSISAVSVSAAAHRAQARLAVAHDGGQRLRHLVHDARAHLSKLEQARGMGRVVEVQRGLRLQRPALGQVADDCGEQPPAGEP